MSTPNNTGRNAINVLVALGIVGLAGARYYMNSHRSVTKSGADAAVVEDYFDRKQRSLAESMPALANVKVDTIRVTGGRSSGLMVWDRNDGSFSLDLPGLPAPPSGKHYHAWAISRDGTVLHLGVVTVSSQGLAALRTTLPPSVTRYVRVDLTLESTDATLARPSGVVSASGAIL